MDMMESDISHKPLQPLGQPAISTAVERRRHVVPLVPRPLVDAIELMLHIGQNGSLEALLTDQH